jgi:N-acetylglucosamine kinase-like BadF-type ATPase
VVVLAVDGGNSKTDVALVADDGALLAAVRGQTVSHQAVGLDEGMDRLGRLGAEVGASMDRPAAVGVFALAGADYPSDLRLLQRGIERLGIAREVVVVNDTMAALRAGSRQSWGIALICGQGVNGLGVAPDGRVVRFDGVGDISGDWGGGYVARAGSAGSGSPCARRPRPADEPREARARSFRVGVSRGRWFARCTRARCPRSVSASCRRSSSRLPLSGDAVARGIVNRLADELGVMAKALIRRLRLGRLDPDVVLAGGVFRADDPAFHQRLSAAVADAAPNARVVRLEAPPVSGRRSSRSSGAPTRQSRTVWSNGLAAELTVLGDA